MTLLSWGLFIQFMKCWPELPWKSRPRLHYAFFGDACQRHDYTWYWLAAAKDRQWLSARSLFSGGHTHWGSRTPVHKLEFGSFQFTSCAVYDILCLYQVGWLDSGVVSMLDSGAERPGFKSQPGRCRITVLGKLFTPIVPLFTKQWNW